MPPGADPMLDLLTRFLEANRFFSYGTLMPGEQRWGLIADLVGDGERASVPGRLYDTGYGYPAALFDDAAAAVGLRPPAPPEVPRVCGWALPPVPGREEELAHLLLAVEGDLYVPRLVRLDGGAGAATFEWLGSMTGLAELADGTWPPR